LKISNVNCNGNYGSFQLSAFLVNYGNSTIEDCNFSNKSSFTFADNHTGMLTIQNTNFSNWEEYGHGGLICTQANLNIDGCIFDNTWDGASWGVVEIRNLSSDDPMVEVNIHNTTFEDPKHSGFGSPYIFNDGNYGFVNISLDNVAFQNIHDGYESLILSYGNGRTDIHLKNTSFENVTTNKASCSLLSNHYGNVYIDGQVTITNCSGGSLWWSSDIITADDARLIVENCESSAGIIRIVADSRLPQASKVNGVTVQNCRTTYPEETYSGNTYGSGGAFYVASGYGCEFSDICVRNNFAEGYGGGIYIPVSRDGNAKITFTNCEIYNNEAGIAGSDIYAEANNKYPISIEAASIGAPLTTDFSGCTDAVTGWFDDSEGSRWQAHAEDPAGNYTERVEPQTFEPGSGVPLALKAAHGNYTLTYQTNGGTWADGSDADVSEVFADGNAATILEAPTREGYEFVEWKGSSYQPGDLYNEKSEDGLTFISDVLVAQWKKIEPKQDPTPTPASTPTKPQNVETIVQSANPAPALSSPAKTIAGNVTTGDETNVMPWILLLAAASACGAAIVASDRRKAGK
ncbi:MAG: InlB B-repeat-containing protein, partial [Eubacterium sp.]|nr:InlB B-repeat-containing protein [Eubacterium sp.]